MITGKNYIGHNLTATGNKKFKTFNPVLNVENDWEFIEATPLEVNEAAELAVDAFKKYSKVSGIKKAKFLREIAQGIEALGNQLLNVYSAESGLPLGRAKGERGRTIGQLLAFADHIEEASWVEASIDTAQPKREPIPKVDLRKMNVPIGPVAVFGASNFPLAFSTAGGDTASALAAGCPVIVKSHPMHAGTGELVASVVVEAAKKTGMPNGVFSNLNSSDAEVGQVLVKHPQIKAVGFTGSIAGGKALYDIAANRKEPIPVFAEMGSVNPVIIFPEALESRAEHLAKTYAGSITLGAGQFCTNPGLIIGIESEALSQFVDTLSEEILKIEPLCMLHPNIYKAYKKNKAHVLSQNEVSVKADYNGGIKDNFAGQVVSVINGDAFLHNPVLHQEVFGPFSIIVQCSNIEQLNTVISKLEGQLTGTVISDNKELEKYKNIVSTLQNKVGRLIFNGVPTGVEVCPSMQHGGPFPASTDSRFTAVGVDSIKRWVRPFSYQDWPNELLPDELKNENPLGISRRVNNVKTKDKI